MVGKVKGKKGKKYTLALGWYVVGCGAGRQTIRRVRRVAEAGGWLARGCEDVPRDMLLFGFGLVRWGSVDEGKMKICVGFEWNFSFSNLLIYFVDKAC